MMMEEFLILLASWAILIGVPVIPFMIWSTWMFKNGKSVVNNIWIDVLGWGCVVGMLYYTWNVEQIFENYGK